jgi:hypothetical protein
MSAAGGSGHHVADAGTGWDPGLLKLMPALTPRKIFLTQNNSVDGFARPARSLIHLRIESNEPQSAYATNVCSREKRAYGFESGLRVLTQSGH